MKTPNFILVDAIVYHSSLHALRDEVSKPTILRAIGRHRAGPAGELIEPWPIVSWFD
jgi:hypothetical protein